ncbi:MAG TPA: ATP-binding protein [Anaeromyxobacter sp.]|nr:ATP-binding protein [Anaeromyxobacter sp.]
MVPGPPTGEEELRAGDLAAALREATEGQAQLFEKGLAAAFRTGADGRILDANPALASLLGYAAPEELRGMQGASLCLDPAERLAFRAQLDRAGEATGELRLRRSDGAAVWALVRASRRRGLEGEEVIEGTLLDITHLREGEAGLVRAGRLASVGALAAGVAHEVNSPLAGILANLAFALEALPGLGASEGEALGELTSALEDARAAAERVRDIVRDLRLFARIEEGTPAPLEVGAVLEATLGLVENQLRHRARVVRAMGEAPRVLADASTLGQAFLNLLLDTAQALPEGAASRHVIQVTMGRTEAGAALVEISDTGPGMTPQALAQAFDPHRPRRPGAPAGMGLPVARAIVEALGGTVTLRSEPGRGTTARVELPPAPATPSPGEPPRGYPHRRRVLVVDDELVVGKSLRRLLPEHEVIVVTSAAEALSLLEHDAALDVLLCDLMMPEVSGIELFRELEARFPELARRVVFITGGAFTPEASAFLRAAGNPVLEKPFDLRRLRALVAGRAEAKTD